MGAGRIHGKAEGIRNRQAHRDPDRPRKVHGRPNLGYCYVHSAVDGFTRLAYSEALDDESAATALAFWARARAFFADHGIPQPQLLASTPGVRLRSIRRATHAHGRTGCAPARKPGPAGSMPQPRGPSSSPKPAPK